MKLPGGGINDIGMFDPCWHERDPESLVWSHAVASRQHPSVNWVMTDDSAGRAAIEFGRMMFDAQARRQARLLTVLTHVCSSPATSLTYCS